MSSLTKIHFHKYHGTGNDFILIDNRNGKIVFDDHDEISFLCHRRFGIGADGLILLEKSGTTDFKMVYFNADGNPSSMCGNGGRCITSFASALGVIGDQATFEAIDGIHMAAIKSKNGDHSVVTLKMNDVKSPGRNGKAYVLDTGSPHFVSFRDDIDGMDVFSEGKKIRNSEPYQKNGINVNFIGEKNGRYLIRTYERGVEDETWSCGTGTVAGALVMDMENKVAPGSPVHLSTKGGELTVSFDKNMNGYENIWLTGAVEKVFEGTIETGRRK